LAVDQDDERYIDRKEIRGRYPVVDTTIWRWINDLNVGFPRPVKLGQNGRDFWWLPEVLAWEQKRRAQQALAPAIAPQPAPRRTGAISAADERRSRKQGRWPLSKAAAE
jgi:prophage regulatory protein